MNDVIGTEATSIWMNDAVIGTKATFDIEE